MFGSFSSSVAVSLAALALCLAPSVAQASPKQGVKSSRVARVAKERPCSKRVVEVVSGKESATFALAKCDGSASAEGVDQISLLARPSGVSRPKESLAALGKAHGSELAPGIRRVDTRVVERLELVVDQFRKTGQAERIVLAPSTPSPRVSSTRRGMARALDFRIEGVTGEALASYCKTLRDTACDPSPRATFVRMALRGSAAAHLTDVDAPADSTPPSHAVTAPVPSESAAKLAPLPAADHPAASMLKPAEPQRFF
jgi:hypothetical protein